MSEETQASQDEPYDYANDPDSFTAADFDNGGDPLLDLLLKVMPIDHINDPDSHTSIGVTLSIGGTLISGLVISQARWLKLWAESIRPHAAPLADGLESGLAPTLAMRAEIAERRTTAGLPTPSPRFIHLEEATIVTGGFRQKVGLWRASRSSIDGWTVATLA